MNNISLDSFLRRSFSILSSVGTGVTHPSSGFVELAELLRLCAVENGMVDNIRGYLRASAALNNYAFPRELPIGREVNYDAFAESTDRRTAYAISVSGYLVDVRFDATGSIQHGANLIDKYIDDEGLLPDCIE